jgi:alpha-N-arabinofuranosidase
VPAISASASGDTEGRLHLTLSNANPHQDLPLKVHLGGMKARQVQGRVLQADAMNAHNTFENPERVRPQAFHGASLSGETLEIVMPKMSVVVLEVIG